MALHFLVAGAFDDLLTRWRHHDDLRHGQDVPLPKLSNSQAELDGARLRMHRLRTAMYPTAAEREEVRTTVLCEVLDEIVHLGREHRDLDKPGNFRCLCGGLIPVPDNWWASHRQKLA